MPVHILSVYDRYNYARLDREMKRRSAELLILSLLEAHRRHQCELGKLNHARSGGRLTFQIDSSISCSSAWKSVDGSGGTWVERPDERRRRFYIVTAGGRRMLAQPEKTWAASVEAVRPVTRDEHA
jgi:DNA-binding PadR family transcriptional regulator